MTRRADDCGHGHADADRSGRRMWRRVVEAETPSREELAAIEAELVAIDAAARRECAGRAGLERRAVDRIVAFATGAAAPAAGQHARSLAAGSLAAGSLAGSLGSPARRTAARALAPLAAALLCSLSIAWVGARVFWPERPASAYVLEFRVAVDDALAADRSAAERASALGFLSEHTGAAIDAIVDLTADADAAVAAAASAARARLAAAGDDHATPADRPPQLAGAGLAADVEIARTDGEPTDRTAAIDRLTAFALTGLATLRQAPCADERGRKLRAFFVADLMRSLELPARDAGATGSRASAPQRPVR